MSQAILQANQIIKRFGKVVALGAAVQADLLGLQAALQSGQIRVQIEETR